MCANSPEVMPRASSVSCSLEPKNNNSLMAPLVKPWPVLSLPVAMRFEIFISSWHKTARHRAACSSVNITSPLIWKLLSEERSVTGCNLLTPDRFRQSGPPLLQQRRKGASETVAWFAIRMDNSTFGIVDAFPSDAGRQAHLTGKVAAALMAKAPELFATAPAIEKVDVLAAKLP
jgi:hypothetical protein